MQFINSLAPSFGALLASPNYCIFFLCIFLLVRFLKLTSFDEKPQITMRSKRGNENNRKKCQIADDILDLAEVIDQCSILNEHYVPPPIWGRNGHIQTAVYGILGHQSLCRTYDKRHFLSLPDGTTATFDVFEPISGHSNGDDFTLVFCPGIANCSESNYIRTCVHLIQENGYRSAVFNHLGVLRDEKLTSERIFSYGGNGEMEEMFKKLVGLYPRTRFIGVGFSMGANVLTNCLARLEPAIRSRIILGISICQGYSATNASPLFMEWESGRRIYNYIITENVKRLLRRNFEMAVKPHVKRGLVDEKQLWSATSLIWLDEWYSRRVHGFDSLEAYYENSSCLPRIKNIQVPMIFLNALDDPLVPQMLWEPVRKICQTHPHHTFILLKHGGHLGFLEGSSPFNPRSITWLDRLILQLAEAATSQTHHQPCSSQLATASNSNSSMQLLTGRSACKITQKD